MIGCITLVLAIIIAVLMIPFMIYFIKIVGTIFCFTIAVIVVWVFLYIVIKSIATMG